MHIAEFRRLTGSQMPWICDNMEHGIKKACGGAPNGELVIDPTGKIVHKRFWSDPNTLRSDLEELVGAVEKPTRVEDLKVRFIPEQRRIASGLVPRMELPGGLTPMIVKPVADEKGTPLYVKLRAEGARGLVRNGDGDLYLGFYMDPIYKVHWNNQMATVRMEVVAGDGSNSNTAKPALSDGPKVSEPADIDPRQFLVQAEFMDKDQPLLIRIHFAVCDDAETFCVPMTQEFEVWQRPDPQGGSRPGVFMPAMFADMMKMDTNGDGHLTKDELPPGKVSLYIGHVDKNNNDQLEPDEIREFFSMFNNGRGFERSKNDGG